jgi:hypothetical protein
VQVVADGRADWIGWVDLKTEPVDELAMRHTAMVIRDLDADVMGVVEARQPSGAENVHRGAARPGPRPPF